MTQRREHWTITVSPAHTRPRPNLAEGKGDEDAPPLRQLLLDAERGDMDLKRLLWRLAFEVHSQSPQDADGEALADISESVLTRRLVALKRGDWTWAHQMVETMKLRAGLLLERAPGVFTFPHRTFQEYLAGAYLSTQGNFSSRALELAAQGVIGPGAQERVMDVARKYACPVQ